MRINNRLLIVTTVLTGALLYVFFVVTTPNVSNSVLLLLAFSLVALFIFQLSLLLSRLLMLKASNQIPFALTVTVASTVLLTLSSFRAAGLAEALLVSTTIIVAVWYFWIRMH